MSSRSVLYSTSSSSSGDSVCPTSTDKPIMTTTTTTTHCPLSVPPTEFYPESNSSSKIAAVSRINKFMQMLLFDEQRSILRDYALRFIKLFAVYDCNLKNLLWLKHDTDYIPNNCKITVPLQPVEGIIEIQAYKDLTTEVASYHELIGRQIKGFVIRGKTLNNNFFKYEATECFVKALPNIAEIFIAESKSPPNIDKHDLVFTYVSLYHGNMTSSLSITLTELQQIYQKVHLRPMNLT